MTSTKLRSIWFWNFHLRQNHTPSICVSHLEKTWRTVCTYGRTFYTYGRVSHRVRPTQSYLFALTAKKIRCTVLTDHARRPCSALRILCRKCRELRHLWRKCSVTIGMEWAYAIKRGKRLAGSIKLFQFFKFAHDIRCSVLTWKYTS